jgi:hypothetical protein
MTFPNSGLMRWIELGMDQKHVASPYSLGKPPERLARFLFQMTFVGSSGLSIVRG